MKRISIAFLSASLLASSAFANEDKVVATYKGGEVKESQIMQQFQSSLDNQPSAKGKKFSDLNANIQKMLVHGYIDTKLLEQEAKNSNIESSKEFQAKLNIAKNQMIQQELMERYVKSHVDEKMINAEYDKLVASLKGKEEVKVSHILLATEKEAVNIKNRLNKGEKFAKLAKDLSKDEGSKENGGEIGYITSGQLVPEFENKALSMKVNEISSPVKTQFGWHIIMVLDKRPAQIPSKEEATANITNRLSRDAILKYVADLESKADVKIMLPQSQVTDETKK
ncbi:MAG TPA: peptidylprolyl isomerase [Rickettsia endosymbiont of Sericostoma sp.]|uniref:peptidylprolyl isomerase n=1 Tax=unclassified Candidatus Tisiphia TaxID=2996318 RepID=UPI001D466C53|nr:peptidylprolyl isomerase [Rickettsia endosymbiont of Sericostoma sp. HW-2014]HJD64208.1 peptidylprolyl isomerase [Rickettsia endosymbiont of Sericostoma sp.]